MNVSTIKLVIYETAHSLDYSTSIAADVTRLAYMQTPEVKKKSINPIILKKKFCFPIIFSIKIEGIEVKEAAIMLNIID